MILVRIIMFPLRGGSRALVLRQENEPASPAFEIASALQICERIYAVGTAERAGVKLDRAIGFRAHRGSGPNQDGIPGQLQIGSVERTTCMPASAKRRKARAASSV